MNIGDLYAESLAAASAAADLILVSPDRYTGFTPNKFLPVIKGFVFQIVGDENVSIQSDITDHYVEDNTTRQDHIAIKPTQITVSGFVGELNDVIDSDIQQVAKDIVDRMGILDAYIPTITITARRIYNTANQILSLGNKILNAIGAAAGLKVKTKQEDAFSKLAEYQKNRTLFYVSTPFGQFANMAIQSLTANQSSDTKSYSDFTVTFKEIRLAKTSLVSLTENGANDTTTVKGTI